MTEKGFWKSIFSDWGFEVGVVFFGSSLGMAVWESVMRGTFLEAERGRMGAGWSAMVWVLGFGCCFYVFFGRKLPVCCF